MNTLKLIIILSVLLVSLWTNVVVPLYLAPKFGKKMLLLYIVTIPAIIALYASIQTLLLNY